MKLDILPIEFPKLFKPNTAMMWTKVFYFECEDGWYDLIRELCEALNKLDLPSTFCVEQIKEKFGTLRFYVTESTNEGYVLIEEAQNLSAHICEYCGSIDDVKLRGGGWLKTLCRKCYNSDKNV